MSIKTARTIAVCAAAVFAAGAFAQEATPRTPSGPSTARTADAFRQADTDGDNRITMQEASKIRGINRAAFTTLDTDKNGTLDANEFAMSSAIRGKNKSDKTDGMK